MAWRIHVDPSRCMASGMCAALAPDLFALDGDHACPVRDEIAPDDTALDAADSCPTAAITVTDGDDVIGPRP